MFGSVDSIITVAMGIGLAAATGLRVFLPLLIAGLAARFGGLPLADGFQWLSTTGTLIALSTASVVEIAAYFVPGLDHLLDIVSAPAALVAGAVASASVMVHIQPVILWPLAIIAGGGFAGLTKTTSALVRAKTGLLTAGLGGPVVSTCETAGAAAAAIVAITVPLLCVLGLTVLLVSMGRWGRRRAPQS